MLYIILSLLISCLFGYALDGYYNFSTVGLIVFASCIFFMYFIDTVVNGVNKAFEAGNATIRACCCEECIIFWLMSLLPVWLWFFISIIGGIITAPLWYLLDKLSDAKIKAFAFWTMLVVLGVLILFGLILIISPITAYKVIHFGWIIGIYIGVAAVLIVISSFLFYNSFIKSSANTLFILCSIALIPIMIFGLVNSLNTIYHIDSASDMLVLKNAPINYRTVFVLENDIDFEGEEVSWYGARKSFKGVFNGQGNTLSNFQVRGGVKKENNNVHYYYGMVLENSGIIRNLNIYDCKITVYDGGHSSNVTYFGLICVNNLGTIKDCKIIDCQVKSQCGNNSMDVHSNKGTIENITVDITKQLDDSFYENENGEEFYRVK